MSTLKELYQKVTSGYYSIPDVIEFVELAAKAINPGKNLDPDLTVVAIRNGFGDALLPTVIEAVEKNPNKVGFQVIKVYSKPNPNVMGRSLIKVLIKDLNDDK